MKNSRKNILCTIFLFCLTGCFLFHAEKTGEFAYIGLETWYEQMIISLFPFMVLMNLLIKTGLSDYFIKPFYIVLRPFFRNTPEAIFVIFFGFLCGFPLGAKCAVDLYKQGKLSKENAQYLVSFSNNPGPAYMLGFFMGKIRPDCSVFYALFVLYGLPLLYGLVLRYTVYKKILDNEYKTALNKSRNTSFVNLLNVLPDVIHDSLIQITMLGGYMILFNALRIIPHLLFRNMTGLYIAAQSLIEISGGLLCVNTISPQNTLKTVVLFAVYSFNGLCCHFQTFSLLQNTPVSAQKYMLHKIILCSITILFVSFFIIR